MRNRYHIQKLTDRSWLNLFEVDYTAKDGSPHRWVMCSRKEKPVEQAARPDAVFIVPISPTPEGNHLVMTREFRAPLDDVEYGFPAGLIEPGETIESTVHRELKEETGLGVETIHHISPPVYSSAGMSDESACMVLVTANGTPSTGLNEAHEHIEVLLYDVDDIRGLLQSDKKIAGKAWGLLYHFAVTGDITFDAARQA